MKKEKVLTVLKEVRTSIETRSYSNLVKGICVNLMMVLMDLNKSDYNEKEEEFILSILRTEYKKIYTNQFGTGAYWWPYRDKEVRVKFLDTVIKDIESGKIIV